MNLLLLHAPDFKSDDTNRVHITGRRCEHILTTLKGEVGTELKVGAVNGNLGTGTITAIGDASVDLQISLYQPPPPPLPLTLICALPRPKSFKKAVSSATSLGVKQMIFIQSWRVQKSYWQSPVLTKKALTELVVLGLEQARDTVTPKISFRRRFKPFVEDELPQLIGKQYACVAHPYNAIPCPSAVNRPAVLIIGPEGGFLPYEIEKLEDAGCKPVMLGERILRVETAIAAFAGRFW